MELFHNGGCNEDEKLLIEVKLNIKENELYVNSTMSIYADIVFDDGISYEKTKCRRIFKDKMSIKYCPMCGRKLD